MQVQLVESSWPGWELPNNNGQTMGTTDPLMHAPLPGLYMYLLVLAQMRSLYWRYENNYETVNECFLSHI